MGVGTAMPALVADLGAVTLYAWPFVTFLAASVLGDRARRALVGPRGPAGPDPRRHAAVRGGPAGRGHGRGDAAAAPRAGAAGPRRGRAGRRHVRADRRGLPGTAAARDVRADLLGVGAALAAGAAGGRAGHRDPVVALGVPRARAAGGGRAGAGRPGRAQRSAPPRERQAARRGTAAAAVGAAARRGRAELGRASTPTSSARWSPWPRCSCSRPRCGCCSRVACSARAAGSRRSWRRAGCSRARSSPSTPTCR